MFFQSASGRFVARVLYRTFARTQFWRSGPKIYVNSLPKSGTHVLTGLLDSTPGLMASGLHIPTRHVNAATESPLPTETFSFDKTAFLTYLDSIRPGQYFTAHLRYHPEIVECLRDRRFRTIFVARDPRDVLVSLLHYVKGLSRHPLHKIILEAYNNDEDRLIALLLGDEYETSTGTVKFVGLAHQLRTYAPWVESPSVMTVRFEDLIGHSQKHSKQRLETIARLADFLGIRLIPEEIVTVSDTARGKRSFTFRKGVAGDWRDVFTPRLQTAFQNCCEDDTERLGYDSGRKPPDSF